MADKILGVMLRCHRRAETLRIVLDELLRLGRIRGIGVRIHVMADRPTTEVLDILSYYHTRLYKVISAGLPLVSKQYGEQFMWGLKVQLKDLQPCLPDFLMIQDDDQWFEPNGITTELPEILSNDHIDMWYAHTLFFWDSPDTYHAERQHHSPKIFRFLSGDDFPLNRIIHATEKRHDSAIIAGRFATMKTPLLDYGAFTAEERQRVYSAFVEAGKVDPYVTSLVAPARLVKYQPVSPWKDLWSLQCEKTHSASKSSAALVSAIPPVSVKS